MRGLEGRPHWAVSCSSPSSSADPLTDLRRKDGALVTLLGEEHADSLAAGAARAGGPAGTLGDDEVSAFVADQLAARDLDGRSVCVLVPDATRSCPLPLLLRAV